MVSFWKSKKTDSPSSGTSASSEPVKDARHGEEVNTGGADIFVAPDVSPDALLEGSPAVSPETPSAVVHGMVLDPSAAESVPKAAPVRRAGFRKSVFSRADSGKADSIKDEGVSPAGSSSSSSSSSSLWKPLVRAWMRMIRFEYALLALPGVFLGAFLAAASNGLAYPPLWSLLWLTVAVTGLRSFAATLDRLVNLDLDRLNVRAPFSALVTGEISVNTARAFAFLSAVVYFAACLFLNQLILFLAPIPVLCVMAGVWARRYTWLVHFVRGLCCGFAPLAGWVGVTPEISLTAGLFACAMSFQVAGFDMLRAVRHVDFDVACRLHSAPVRFGLSTTVSIAGLCHTVFALFLGMAFWAAGFGLAGWAAWLIVAALLTGERHLLGNGESLRAGTQLVPLTVLTAGVVVAGTLLALYL